MSNSSISTRSHVYGLVQRYSRLAAPIDVRRSNDGFHSSVTPRLSRIDEGVMAFETRSDVKSSIRSRCELDAFETYLS